MKAIRGAITLNGDTEKEVRENVKFLLGEIVSANKLIAEDIICIMFSNTSDIRSFYPAKAAREAGFFNCALYSSLEPEINGSLPYCIRVMILAEITAKPKHIYLKGASDLRKDITQKLNIAIDGPAGSGKSTVSKLISSYFDILYLDTGAMYRACALACINEGVERTNESEVEKIAKKNRYNRKIYRRNAENVFKRQRRFRRNTYAEGFNVGVGRCRSRVYQK